MKKTFSIVVLLIFSIVVYAQKDVTQFLGIPIDGSKSEMIKKLKKKGFKSSLLGDDLLMGEFNGADVALHIVTTNNKVCRIVLLDVNPTEYVTDIKIRFNNLCWQFQNSSKYVSLTDVSRYIIPENYDISYEMMVNHKRYDAIFFQNVAQIDSISLVSNLTKMKLDSVAWNNMPEEQKKEIFRTAYLGNPKMIDIYSKKRVWFMIHQKSGMYSIAMFYDNEYNMADGSDL